MNFKSIQKGERVVIIGGGFAGLQLAKSLRNTGIKVVLVDRQNHHMFQPLFYQVASGRLEPSSISFPFRKVFQKSRNIDFRMSDIRKIVPEENKLITAGDREGGYDHLVIATHGTDRRFQLAAARILVGLPRTDQWLLADDP